MDEKHSESTFRAWKQAKIEADRGKHEFTGLELIVYGICAFLVGMGTMAMLVITKTGN